MLEAKYGENDLSDNKTVVCFLVINRIEQLPEIAISSFRAVSRNHIYIGFIDSADIENIPKISGITFVSLAQKDTSTGIKKYQDFTQSDFYTLVQYKWILLQRVLEVSEAAYGIYVDLDVLWIQNPIPSIQKLLNENDYIIAIQDFTKDVASPNLCMGFVAIKNSPKSFDLLREASILHAHMLAENSKVGDDDVITEMYGMAKWRELFFLLPQATFPVGNLANLFSGRNLYPGLSFSKPFIFHANYVIGNRRKIEFMRLMAKRFGISIKIRRLDLFRLFVALNLKRLKNRISFARNSIRR